MIVACGRQFVRRPQDREHAVPHLALLAVEPSKVLDRLARAGLEVRLCLGGGKAEARRYDLLRDPCITQHFLLEREPEAALDRPVCSPHEKHAFRVAVRTNVDRGNVGGLRVGFAMCGWRELLLQPAGDRGVDVDRLGARRKESDDGVFLEVAPPSRQLRIRLEPGKRRLGPVGFLTRHERQDRDAPSQCFCVLELRDASRFALRDVPACKAYQEDAELTVAHALLGQHLWLVARGGPFLHGIDENPAAGETIDDVGAMVFEVPVCRGDERADHARRGLQPATSKCALHPMTASSDSSKRAITLCTMNEVKQVPSILSWGSASMPRDVKRIPTPAARLRLRPTGETVFGSWLRGSTAVNAG